jgi:hypothetical protein
VVPADVIDSDAELATLMAAHELLQGFPDKAERYWAHVSCGMHDAICRLYDHLWDQAPPEDNPAERAAAAVARALARQHDWPTPAALVDDLIDDPAYQPEGGWLPATLVGVPQRPVPAPPAAPPALITPCRAPAAGLVWPVRGHRTSTTMRVTATTQLRRPGVPHGTAPA